MTKSRKHRILLDFTLNKSVTPRIAVTFMREAMRRVDWNEREYVIGLYADRVEAKNYLKVVDGLLARGASSVEPVGVEDGDHGAAVAEVAAQRVEPPTYEELEWENARLREVVHAIGQRASEVLREVSEGPERDPDEIDF